MDSLYIKARLVGALSTRNVNEEIYLVVNTVVKQITIKYLYLNVHVLLFVLCGFVEGPVTQPSP